MAPTKPASEQKGKPSKAYAITPYRVRGRLWAQRLKRVFAIDIAQCERCAGPVRVIASIEDPEVIARMLKHLGLDKASGSRNRLPPEGLFDYTTNLF